MCHYAQRLLSTFSVICATLVQAQTVVREWKPRDLADWSLARGANLRVENDMLAFDTMAGDSMLVSPAFGKVATSPWQHLELEMSSDISGPAQLFWTGSAEGEFGGFSSEKTTAFGITAGSQIYRIEPLWHPERQILRLRVDFPEESAGHYKIKALRVVEEVPPLATLPTKNVALNTDGAWNARLNRPAQSGSFMTLRLSNTTSGTCRIRFASDSCSGWHLTTFPLRTGAHTYNVDLSADTAWSGNIIALRVEPGVGGKIEMLSLGADPHGVADLQVTFLGTRAPIARTGQPQKIEAIVRNDGGDAAAITNLQLHLDGAQILSTDPPPECVEFGLPETLSWMVQAEKPGAVRATLSMAGVEPFASMLDFRAPLNLAKADYVPQPKPAKTDYQIGAYYFPGWHTSSCWAPLKAFPERKPLLGYYREGDPEVADWQIKWAVEHGISYFLYDWYWDRGSRQLEHGLDALFKARYQNYLKFALLYANHNGIGSHSAEDFENMTRFWIGNYFKRTNYLKINGKPVVVFFAPMNPVRDMGAENVKTSFEKMRNMCCAAGLKGLYLIACSSENPSSMAEFKALGYDAVSAYNWPRSGMTEAEQSSMRAPYAGAIAGYKNTWDSLATRGGLTVIPPVCAGWDPRPWHGDKSLVRFDRTPELFKKHLLDAKLFIDNHESGFGPKMIFIEAWNELGEGSYIEPHREFGFGYLEAIRQVFAPLSPKPEEIVPQDVGLGPYDLPDDPTLTAWDFTHAANLLGWSNNVANPRIENGALRFTTRGNDPALASPMLHLRAADFPILRLRMKASRDLDCQLFWSSPTSPVGEASSTHFALKGDDQFHDLTLRLSGIPRWRGVITTLRLDPGSVDGVDCAVEFIRLSGESSYEK